MEIRLRRAALLLLPLSWLSACHRPVGNPAPPRIETPLGQLPGQSSSITVPIVAPLSQLERGLDKQTPRTLWSIDERREKCVPGQRVARVKVTPDLSCRITGTVTRGAIDIAGEGERLVITMPVTARISVSDIAGVLHETATGSATVRATGKLGIVDNWRPTATLDLRYRWRQEPGIDIAGQRITFTSRADEKLAPVMAKLERDLPGELAKLDVRRQLDRIWRQAFTVIELSKHRPPAWMRITPRSLGFGGYRVEGRHLRMTLSAEALTETFVGDRPADPTPTALPPPAHVTGRPGLRFFVPVLADYRELEPVVQRTLRKLAARGISITGVGPVDVRFGDVTVYATTGGRLAIGVKASVRAREGGASATGEAWLSALPYNDPGSQYVRARNIQLATRTDSRAVDLLIRLLDTTQVQEAVALALQHDFGPDYRKVIDKAHRAIGHRREGDFILSTTITNVVNGHLRVTGAGLFLPVRAEGDARIDYRPRG
ncbi:DUF4403 family protein [Sphingomonas sp.]|jgi:hypothetical protein|uniref:DUF4403 family protein n=1 Tax=Sphingomonas sp. TaxID=28214 RepID=UPI0035C7CDC0